MAESVDLIERFIKEDLPEAKKRSKAAYELIHEFQNDYPIESIKKMTLEDYLYVPYDEYNPSNSFCSRIWNEMNSISSKGDIRTNVFGIYKLDGQIKTHGKYLEPFGMDIDGAFRYLLDEIYTLLIEIGKNNYEAAAYCKLNRAFRYKLLEIYYPDKFIHVHTESKLNDYCDSVGLSYNPNDEQIYRNLALKEWKDSVPEVIDWDNSVFMNFCEWLCNNHKKIDGSSYVVNTKSLAKEIEQEVDGLHLEGEEREAVVKVRVNQSVFRKILLRRYSKCCLCNVGNKSLLVASHIKPWSVCNPDEKLDIDNGFIMCPNHDKLFDQGWISFTDNGEIMISKDLEAVDRMFMNVQEGAQVSLTDKNKEYLKYHRDNIYLG